MDTRVLFHTLCFLIVFKGASGFHWTSTSYLNNNTNIKTCIGDTVTLNWTFTLDAEDNIDTVRWHFVPQDNPDVVEAILVSGNFLPLPGSQHYGRLQYMPNAGIQLTDVTLQDSGTYWVQVNLDRQGSPFEEVQSADVQVSGPDTCRSTDELLQTCLAQNNDLTSQAGAVRGSVQRQETQIAALKSHVESCIKDRQPVKTTAPPPAYPSWFRPKECRELKLYNSTNGVYTIFLNYTTPLNVYCDQTDSGGEWLVIQRRKDGTVDFYRNWTQYEEGFGDLNGEFWLGLKYISALTKSHSFTLKVTAEDYSPVRRYALYTQFVVEGPALDYRLTVGGYSGDIGNTLPYSNNMPFSTFDRDHDNQPDNANCAEITRGAWWWNTCSKARYVINLNGRYKLPDGTGADNILWDYNFGNHPLSFVEMKIRLNT